MQGRLLSIFWGSLFVVLLLCARGRAEGIPLDVVVGVPPLKFVVERLGGALVRVDTMIKAGSDPHTFEPAPRKVLAVSTADVIILSGMEFEEKLIARLSGNNRQQIVLDLGKSQVERPEETGKKSHLHDEDHNDPHTWLSPLQLLKQVKFIAELLRQQIPAQEQLIRFNEKRLLAQILDLHQRLQNQLAPFRGMAVYVYHPAFSFFCREYGLVQEAVEEGGKAPSARRLAALISQARDQGIKVIFAQPQFDQKSVNALARAIGATIVPMDPLAENVLTNYQKMADEIISAYGH